MNKFFCKCIIIISILLVGCADIYTYQTNTAIANTKKNQQLGRLQRIQTLQFELLEHPEYETNLPDSIKSTYTDDEIDQAFKNLKWRN